MKPFLWINESVIRLPQMLSLCCAATTDDFHVRVSWFFFVFSLISISTTTCYCDSVEQLFAPGGAAVLIGGAVVLSSSHNSAIISNRCQRQLPFSIFFFR